MLANVNLLQGTESTREFSTGNTLPLVARPWGMHHWTLQSGKVPWLFNRRDTRMHGIRMTHQPSPWMWDYGSITLLPFTGEALDTPEAQASSYRLEDAVLRPNFMQATLLRYGVTFSMTPTERGALFVFEFRGDQAPKVGFFFDGEHSFQARDKDTLGGASFFKLTQLENGYGLHYRAQFSCVPTEVVKTEWGGYAEFPVGIQRVEMRISASFIDEDQAALSAERELNQRSLDDIKREGAEVWNNLLKRVEISSVDEDQLRLFYSCLYRCLLFPRFLDEVDASGATCHRSPYDGEVHGGSLCADSGFWDVYRTLYPLLILCYPDVLRRMLDGWMNACYESGWAPKWPSPGPRQCMIGTHFDVFVADIVAKGITDWDVQGAFEYLWRDATEISDDLRNGREGLQDFIELGYVPADRTHQSGACTLDYAYDDFCIAQVARYLGRETEATMLMKRAQNYRNVFDASVGFMRGKNADGTWLEPFSEFTWGGPFVEGSTWQHTFNVPHDPQGLAELFGGPEALCAKLDQMLSTEPRFEAGTYKREIHEASEMAAADFGQYAHSNQPVHGFLFLYALMGQPEKTSHWVHRVCNELYTVETFPGDEDNGEMAAWYIWACLGLYPQCPGTDEYVCFEPLLDEVKIHIPGKETPLLFGKKYAGSYVTLKHSEIPGQS